MSVKLKPKIKAVEEWVKTCPLLGPKLITLDFLDGAAGSFSVMSDVTSQPIVRRYIDGSTLRRYNFSLVSNEFYSPDQADSISASSFYEELASWIEQQNLQGNLPDIPGIQSLEIDMPGYLYVAEADIGRYTIACHLLYLQ